MLNQELENLVNVGAQIDGNAQAEQEQAAGLPPPITEDEKAMQWLIIPQLLSFVIKTILPETAAHYNEHTEMQMAKAIVPVADKYGWSGMESSPELMLGVAAFGFSMPAVLAYKSRKKTAQQQSEQPEKDITPEAQNGG